MYHEIAMRLLFAAVGAAIGFFVYQALGWWWQRRQCPRAYREMFEARRDRGDQRPQGYVIRVAAPDSTFGPAIEWILFGDAIRHDEALRRAWDIASGTGLGPKRCRFHIRETVVLGPGGSTNRPDPWTLDQAQWPWERCTSFTTVAPR